MAIKGQDDLNSVYQKVGYLTNKPWPHRGSSSVDSPAAVPEHTAQHPADADASEKAVSEEQEKLLGRESAIETAKTKTVLPVDVS